MSNRSAPAVFPPNKQFSLHFREFCLGYRVGAEAVEVKFPHATSTRIIKDFSVGIVDGFLKTLCMAGIVAIADQLVPWLKHSSPTFHIYHDSMIAHQTY